MNRTKNAGLNAARTIAGAALLLAAGQVETAHAHQIWIEQDGKQAKVFFGEYAENLREASPGRLDKFVGLTATVVSPKGEKTVAVSKAADAFVVPVRVGKDETLVVQDPAYPVLSRKPGGKNAAPAGKSAEADKPVRTLWAPAARFVGGLREQAPKLALDIVPAGKPGEFQVVFRGKPLPAAKVDILAASGWGREAETDAAGKVTFELPWKSGYLVKVHHVDATPGARKGAAGEEPYDAASFSTSLSFVTPTGLAAPPASAPKKPSPETAMAGTKAP